MKGMRPATQFLVCWLAATGAAAQTVDLQSAPGRRTIDGHVAGGRAGAWLHIGDLTGDYWTKELIVGVPDDASGRGTVRLYLGTQRVATDSTTATTDVVITGGAAGDHFGAAVDAGYVTQREVQVVNGNPSGATPPRDLIVGAPGADGGRGNVYLFPGPFVRNTSRTAATAAVRIVGAAGDAIGSDLESADLNGDGFREVIIPVASRGIVYVVDVHNSASTTIDLGVGVPGTVLTGLASPIKVAAGDMTGDGIVDLAVSTPTAQEARGAVYLFVSRSRVLPASIDVSSADAQFVGEEPGDQFGGALWVADIDDDSDFAADLLVGAPGADGPGNTRPDAGAVYVIWGQANLPAAFRPSLVLHGASTGDRLGAVVTAGQVTRRTPQDVVALASGANAGAGAVFVYYGRHRFEFPSSGVADLASSASRRILADETVGPIRTVRVWEATGEGAEEIVVGVPDAATSAGAAAGRIYIALSPRIDLSTTTATLRATRCVPGVQQIEIRNPSVIPVPWQLFDAPAWAEIQPATGTTVLGAPATVRLVVRTGDLAPGTYSQRVEVRSMGPDLGYAVPVNIQLTVDPAAPLRRSANVDFNGDGCGDVASFQPATGTWRFGDGSTLQLGGLGDIPVPADYTGDFVADAAVYHRADSTWHFANSNVVTFGQRGDIPVPADYNGDGRTDIAVYRPVSATWVGETFGSIPWGRVGDIPVPADYDGDGIADLAVFDRTTATWKIRNVGEFQFGEVGDIPVPGDYDGDGRADIAVYHRQTGMWRIRGQFEVAWGSPSDIPAALEMNRDGKADLAVFQRATGTWNVYDPATGVTTPLSFGTGQLPAFGPTAIRLMQAGADPTPDGQMDIGVWRPGNGVWFVKTSPTAYTQWTAWQWGSGALSDRIVPGDYDGDGVMDLAVWRPGNGVWFVRTSGSGYTNTLFYQWGSGPLDDRPVPGDYDGDGRTDVAVWRPASGMWYVRTSSTQYASFFTYQWGAPGDVPVAADFDGDGRTDIAVWRPSNGVWYIRHSSTGYGSMSAYQWGAGSLGDVPVPGDFDGDGRADVAVWRPGNGVWYIRKSITDYATMLFIQWGAGSLGDVPLIGDYDGDGRSDITVWRPGNGVWFVKKSSSNYLALFTVQWGAGSLGDVPIR